MKKGDLFTVSASKLYGDRSYTQEIWSFVEENETQIWAYSMFGNGWGRKPEHLVCFVKSERTFHPCSRDLLSSLQKAACVPMELRKDECA